MKSKTRSLTCGNKVRHTSKKSAADSMNSYRRSVGWIKLNAQVYKCGDHWHWGHSGPNRRRRK